MIDFTLRNGLGLGRITNTRQECLWISMDGAACETGQSVSVVRTLETCLWGCTGSVAPGASEDCKSRQVLHIPCVDLPSFSQVCRCCADGCMPCCKDCHQRSGRCWPAGKHSSSPVTNSDGSVEPKKAPHPTGAGVGYQSVCCFLFYDKG